MPLSPRSVDLQYIGPRLVRGDLGRLMSLVASGSLEVGSVFEIIQVESSPERRFILHTFGLLDVAGSAPRQFLSGLVGVTGVAIGMLWHAGLQPFSVKTVTKVAFHGTVRHLRRIHLALHFLRVHMVAMRKTLQTKLGLTRGEVDKRGFGGR